MLNLKKLDEMLDSALEKETAESLNQWLDGLTVLENHADIHKNSHNERVKLPTPDCGSLVRVQSRI